MTDAGFVQAVMAGCHVPTALFHGDLFRASVSTAPVARGETGLGVVTLDPDSNSRQAP